MDELIEKLESVIGLPENGERPADVYLPIDRVFSLPGAGTIVTGTLVGGALIPDISVRLEPSGQMASVRGVQVASQQVAAAPAGARVAVNLRNIDAKSVKKGQVLCAAGAFQNSDRFDVSLDYHDAGLKHMQHVMILLGTSAAPARLRLHRSDSEGVRSVSQFAQIELTSPLIAYAGQRFAIRNPASAETLTGGIILDPNARLITRAKDAHIDVLEAALAGDAKEIANALTTRGQGSFELETLARLARQPVDELHDLLGDAFDQNPDGVVFRCTDISRLQRRYTETLSVLHAEHPCRPQFSVDQIHDALRPVSAPLLSRVEKSLRDTRSIRLDERGVALASHNPLAAMSTEQIAAYRAAETRLVEIALHPAPVFEPDTQTPEQSDLLDLLVWSGRAVPFYNHSLRQSFLFHIDSVAAAREALAKAFPGETSFTTGDARAALATNRKTIVPLLEHFDQFGVTKRNGNLRYIVHPSAADEPCAPVSSD